jgi:hypothetical protein
MVSGKVEHRYRLSNVDEKDERTSNVDMFDKSPSTKTDLPMLRLQRDSLQYVTDLSSDERSNVEHVPSTKSSPRRRRSDILMLPTPPSMMSSQNVTPRGATAILASQIDQEILELRNFYEQHREEMMSLAKANTSVVQNRSTVHSVDTQTSTKSPTKHSRQFGNRQSAKYLESESDSVDLSLQEERRIEFQQRRLRQLQKKKLIQNEFRRGEFSFDKNRRDMSLSDASIEQNRRHTSKSVTSKSAILSPPNFAIGNQNSPVAVGRSKSHAISSFFPPVSSNEAKQCRSVDGIDGRRVEAADGDDIFIPKLNLEELVSLSYYVSMLTCHKRLMFSFFQ